MAEIASFEKVRNAAQAFRFANLVVGLAALCWIVFAVAAGQRDGSPTGQYVASMAVARVIVTPLLVALVAYRLARSIDAGSPLL